MMPDMPYAHAVPDPLERVTNLLALLLESRTPLTLQQISDQLTDWYAGNATAVLSLIHISEPTRPY